MANKSILRVQVSLRRVVNFNEQYPEQEEQSQSDEKAALKGAKRSKAQGSR